MWRESVGHHRLNYWDPLHIFIFFHFSQYCCSSNASVQRILLQIVAAALNVSTSFIIDVTTALHSLHSNTTPFSLLLLFLVFVPLFSGPFSSFALCASFPSYVK